MPSRASTRRSGAALSRHGGMPACRAEVTGGQKMQHALKTGGRKMTRADSEKLRFELRSRPTSARTSWQQNRDRGRMLQNYDGSSSYGDPAMAGRWAGAQHAHNSPIHSPNADTSSQTGYNIANDKTPLICRL